jgi:hypothetical protein
METAPKWETVSDVGYTPPEMQPLTPLPQQPEAIMNSVWNYQNLLARYLSHARWIKVIDPFCRNARQVESLLLLAALVENPSECRMHLVTCMDELGHPERQTKLLDSVQAKLSAMGMTFTYDIGNRIETRSIVTERWEIRLDQGLDLFRIQNGSLCTRPDPLEIRPRF